MNHTESWHVNLNQWQREKEKEEKVHRQFNKSAYLNESIFQVCASEHKDMM
jgi:hypothetical protein